MYIGITLIKTYLTDLYCAHGSDMSVYGHMTLSTTRALRVKHFATLCPVIYSVWSMADLNSCRSGQHYLSINLRNKFESVTSQIGNRRGKWLAHFCNTIHFPHFSKAKRLVDKSLEVKIFPLDRGDLLYTSCT